MNVCEPIVMHIRLFTAHLYECLWINCHAHSTVHFTL